MDDGALSFDFESHLHQQAQQQRQQAQRQGGGASSSFQQPSDSRDYRGLGKYKEASACLPLRQLSSSNDYRSAESVTLCSPSSCRRCASSGC